MLSNRAFNESISRQFQQEKCQRLWVTEPCVNMILMLHRGMGGEIITRWNEFISGNAERNKSTSQMSNKILKEDGVSKAAWLLQLHQGTLSAMAINVFQTPRRFLRAQLSLAANPSANHRAETDSFQSWAQGRVEAEYKRRRTHMGGGGGAGGMK